MMQNELPPNISLEKKAPDSLIIPFNVDQMARTWRFAFRGNAMEYFKIWITNLFLTIITLTLYAPWAKVRRLRYFYGNTYLNQRKFDFTGVPLKIFKGRIIALIIFGLFSTVSQLSVEAYAISFILMFVVVPWIIRSSLRFRARNSKYANGRFYFAASMGQTYKVLISCALIVIFSFGLLLPIALLWFKRYQLNHLYVGQVPFRLTASIGDFFAAVLLPSLMFVGVLIVAGVMFGIAFFSSDIGGIFMFLAMILYIFGIFYLGPLIQGYLFKATWNHVEIGNSIMKTTIDPWKFAWVQVSNSIAIIFSFGLLLAWANIRIYRYKVESLSVEFFDDPNQISNMLQQDHSALAEELADVFDIDISI